MKPPPLACFSVVSQQTPFVRHPHTDPSRLPLLPIVHHGTQCRRVAVTLNKRCIIDFHLDGFVQSLCCIANNACVGRDSVADIPWNCR